MRECIIATYQHPDREGEHGNSNHHGDEYTCNFIYEFLNGRLTALCFLHHFDDVGKNGITSYFLRFKLKAPFLIDGARKYFFT